MTPHPGRHGAVWTLILTSAALFIVTLDNLVVSTALPTIRRDLHASIQQLEWTVNAYTLTFAVLLLTGAALGDRFGRRRMFVTGIFVFVAGSVRRRTCTLDPVADRGAGLPGRRWRDHRPADAHHPVGLRAGRAPRRGARHLGRRRGPGRGPGPSRRRRRRPGRLVAVDLLAQRADRPGARPAGGPAPRGVLRAQLGARSARRRPGVERSARRRLRDHPRQPDRLGRARGHRLARRRRRAGRRVRALGTAHEHADAADALLCQPDVHGRQHRVDDDVLRDVRGDVLADPIPADRAGLLTPVGGAAGAAVDGDAADRGPDRRRPVGQDRRAHADGRGDRAAVDRARDARGTRLADGCLRAIWLGRS